MLFLVWVFMVGAWGVDGGWMPLPTRPQRYCDPASLVLFINRYAFIYIACTFSLWLGGYRIIMLNKEASVFKRGGLTD